MDQQQGERPDWLVARFLELLPEQAHSEDQTAYAVGRRNKEVLFEQHAPYEDIVLQPKN